MNVKIILLLIFFSITNIGLLAQIKSFKKNNNRNVKGITLEKKTHYFTGFFYPIFETGNSILNFKPGISLGYGYFIKNNWSIENNIFYQHDFNLKADNNDLKNNDGNTLEVTITNKYFFYQKKRIAFSIGLDASVLYFSYRPSNLNPSYIFFNDIANGNVYKHIIPSLSPFLSFNVKVGKRFLIYFKLGYRHNFQSKKGKYLLPPVMFGYGINYNFKKLKRIKVETVY